MILRFLPAALFIGCLFGCQAAYATKQDPAEPTDPPSVLLHQLMASRDNLSYEYSYLLVNQQGIDVLRYRHARIDDVDYAQLLQVDGPRREVLQRGTTISYFDETAGIDPFSLQGSHIIDGLPPVFFADFDQLRQNYHFISLGRARVADHLCNIVRIVSKDGLRYGYVLWLDSETTLPLQAALLTPNGDTIEQVRVVKLVVGQPVLDALSALKQRVLPAIMPRFPHNLSLQSKWRLRWIPAGFRLSSESRHPLAGINQQVESRLYTDGLFDFTVNVMEADGQSHPQLLSSGARTVKIKIINGKEVSFVGELPPETAERILNSIMIESSP